MLAGVAAQTRWRPAALAAAAAMHSFWQRLNAIFFYTLSVLGFLAFLAAGLGWNPPTVAFGCGHR